ncbi:zinc-binding dehydrogenase [Microbacterium sp.]|jgi:(R,R)-butanediol dehydrogenase/meso-butanediol dehydrogenase/diacetyl reductase|uniref:zinc-binding dehydrogenase n=1 Tax=Microbacterium sp. TaxID=51671 RepID=UPI0037C82518
MTPVPPEMTAAVLTAPDTIDVLIVPVPEVREGWALIKTEYTGLCGSDFSILHGTHPRAGFPLVMGHEITGIVEVAAGTGPAAGSRVVIEPLISCGVCAPCRRGETHVCQRLGLYGIDVAGSLAEYVTVPADALIAVHPAVPVLQVALAEPLAVAVHAVERSGLSRGDTVAVFGAGPIGILTALVARHQGGDVVLVSEPSSARRDFASSLGFPVIESGEDPVEAVTARTDGDGVDFVFDTAAHPSVAAAVTRVARVRGTVVTVGVYKKPVEVDLQTVTFAELTVIGVRVYTRADLEQAVKLITEGDLGLERLPVDVFPLAETAQALARAMAAGPALKILVASGDGA